MKYYKIRDIIDSHDSISQKAFDLFRFLLKPNQREIFDNIPKGSLNAISALEIKEKTGIPTKNIYTQIKQMSVSFPIGVIEVKRGSNKYYRKE